ncbi:acetyl/propionyl/methylcrotonyl-CoA carboxylase subunit alpha [Halopseudomonas salegens]|uniref:Biotin carboxylase n=1 Tax=Halopseudomonas salegens TaxID=1434072 RepID=A0A1H2HFE1_9GAMM|nr:acetyl/propionyl/methylcrotonyl-CoA carboxylase subunit alpha [Halopseudomonas salegens]SDU30607.1 3-methylcrotonyl-CoA carboxylase alpha subunit [Halopseudomonas salegens]
MRQPMFNTLLIANRGEIACRIIRTARDMGITSVAVYSDTDRDAPHVPLADRAVALGGSRPADSYLDSDKLLAAAKTSGAQAVHPGYGFLAENADFAAACEQAGLCFIGPSAAAIAAMGSKSSAKALMAEAGVPLVPGYHGAAQDNASLRTAAEQIGYPLLLKASAGGGGKGMKVVNASSELDDALDSAKREAQSAFADAQLLVEKYLQQPRHIEVQILADQYGNCCYLHDRDCSIQRRHQKVLEEAPAPGLSDALRQHMGQAAVRAARAIDYVGAGTVEFLLDSDGQFYFMEMNTRLQVEHPVTEAITGLDLVAWQVRIAAGEPFPLQQADIPCRGHAMEVRLYAEDPQQDFLPASGELHLYQEPSSGPGRRVDSGVVEGDSISPWYDPMLAKLIAHGDNREQARLRLLAMLDETAVGGLKSNLLLLKRILTEPAFAAAELDTGFIPRHSEQLLTPLPELDESFWAHAASALLDSLPPDVRDEDPNSPWSARSSWQMGLPAQTDLHVQQGEQQTRACFTLAELPPAGHYYRRGERVYLPWQGDWLAVHMVDPLASRTHAQTVGDLSAPMNASMVRVLVQAGDSVVAGQALLVLEAMKMEHSLRAPVDGVVSAILCQEGDLINQGQTLISLDEHANAASEHATD